MNANDLLKRIESGYTLPSLSPVALKLIELASDERSSVDDLVRLIEKDPSLALRLLNLQTARFLPLLNTAPHFIRPLSGLDLSG